MSLIRRGTGRVVGRKVLPWLLLLDLLRETHAHWQDQLTDKERRRLTELLRASKGRPSNLSDRQRREVRELAGKLDLLALGKRAALTTAGAKVGRKGRR